MKNDIILNLTKTGLVYKNYSVLGMQNENEVSNIIYKFEENFVSGTGYLEVNFGYIHHLKYVCIGNESGTYEIKRQNITFTMPQVVADDELIYYPTINQLILDHNGTRTLITTNKGTNQNKLIFTTYDKGQYQMSVDGDSYKLPIYSTILLQKSKIYLQLTIYKDNNVVYKSNQTYLEVKDSINANDTIVKDYPNIMSMLNNKVDKIAGKGLSTNDFTNTYKNNVDDNIRDRHTHSNKSLLDTITNTGDGTKYLSNDGTYKTVEGGSSNYNNLTNKPTIPSKTSDLTNDSGYIDKEVNDLTNYTTTTNLNTLLASKQDIIQYATMPTATSSLLGKIIEYIGATTSDYTNGYFYQCTDTSVQESITISQTDNIVPLGTLTIDNNAFKSKVSAGVHEFYYRGYNTKLNFSNISVFPPVSIQVTRDNTFDRSPMIPNGPRIYSWVDNSNNFYVTDTLNPNGLTKLYLLDINTNEYTDTGATFISSNTPSLLEGRWTKKEGDIYTDVDITEYGIYMSSAGLPGNTISVNYVEANESYSWIQKNVQPINLEDKLKSIIGYDETSTQVLKNINGTLNWVNE